LPMVSIKRIGAPTRPTSRSLFGVEDKDFAERLQAKCFELVRQSWMQRRAKSKVSSEPEFRGIACAVPRLGHGAREAVVR
jgi:hypothetical protein